jgi:hypothetical protein
LSTAVVLDPARKIHPMLQAGAELVVLTQFGGHP